MGFDYVQPLQQWSFAVKILYLKSICAKMPLGLQDYLVLYLSNKIQILFPFEIP